MTKTLDIVILGLSITSSWGNGHATTYRSLVAALAARGHRVTFLERDVPWYAAHRDLPQPPGCRTFLYGSLGELEREHGDLVYDAHAVIVGSYVPQGVEIGDWVAATTYGIAAFYDIDTPVTLAKLERGDFEYLSPDQIAQYDLYLSFTGGPVLDELEREWGSPCARALYCSVDPARYVPSDRPPDVDLGYLGTYSDDRQPALERLLLEPARRWPEGRFVVAGAKFPDGIDWPPNVERIEHLAPDRHAAFYGSQRFTLNLTRADMIRRGYSPSVRLFEAAACATPVISDRWAGIGEIFGEDEIVLADSTGDVLRALRTTSETRRRAMANAARRSVLARHTSAHRAVDLERALDDAAIARTASVLPGAVAAERMRTVETT